MTELGAALLAGSLAGVAAPTALAAAAACVLVARAADLQRPRLVLELVDDLPGLFVAAAVATVVLVGPGGASPVVAGLVAFGLVLGHAAVYALTRLLRRTGRLRRRVLVVGTGPTARRLALTLLARPELGLEPTGFVCAGHRLRLDEARGLPLALLGPVSALPRAMTEARVNAAVVALASAAGEEEVAAVDGLLASSAAVYAVPDWFPAVRGHARHPGEVLSGVPVVRLYRRGSWGPVRLFKRLVELLVALVALAALAPVAAVLAALVWLETGGVLVRQEQPDLAGWGTSARFRTRRSRSVARPGTTFSVAIPGRLGPVGRLLRRSRLDALPELLLTLLRRVRHPGGVSPRLGRGSAFAPDADQAEVHVGQLMR